MSLPRWTHGPLSFVGAQLIRSLRYSMRLSFVDRHHFDQIKEKPHILAFWHKHLFLMAYGCLSDRTTALISRHGDGEMIARAVSRFGYKSARGSSTRGGVSALRGLIRVLKDGGDLAMTPDGPRGPAQLVKPGVIQVAALTGVPILPVTFAARKKKV